MSNLAQIYQNAINPPEEPVKQESEGEEKDQKDLRFLNYNLQQTTREIKSQLIKRTQEIDISMASLVQREGMDYSINKLLLEKTTINKVLSLITTGTYV